MGPTTSVGDQARPEVIRVIVADDHKLVRTGLRMLLGMAKDIEVVGEAADGIEALAIIERLAPQVAVLDIDMPRMDGLAATRALVAGKSTTRALILTMHVEEGYRVSLRNAGAAGYLTKGAADRELGDAIRAVASGRVYTQSDAHGTLARVPESIAPAELCTRYERLSERERLVLVLIAGGWSASEIGVRLLISPKTVESLRERIGKKLGCTRRTDYLRLCLRLGLLQAN